MRRTKHLTVFALTVVMFMPGMLMASEPNQTKARKEAVKLTEQIKRTSHDIERETERLSTMHSTQISNKSHQYALSRIATDVNEGLQPALARLAELQPELPQWHKEAIDQMHATATNIAANANAAIHNRNPDGSPWPAMHDPEYRQLIKNLNSGATALVQMADATADYGSAQLKGQRAGLAVASHD